MTGAEAESALAAAVDPSPDAGSRLVAEEDLRLLREALDALPEESREVVILYYREGRSSAQVASLLGISDEAVRQRLSRARARLREDLERRASAILAGSAPGAGFTAAVLGAIATGAPAAAGAATAAAGAGAKWAASALGISALVVAAPAVGGALAIADETRRLAGEAADERERAALRRAGRVGIAWLLAFTLALPLLALALGARWLFASSFGVFALGMTAIQGFWIPRISAARHAALPRRERIKKGFARWGGVAIGLAAAAMAFAVAVLKG